MANFQLSGRSAYYEAGNARYTVPIASNSGPRLSKDPAEAWVTLFSASTQGKPDRTLVKKATDLVRRGSDLAPVAINLLAKDTTRESAEVLREAFERSVGRGDWMLAIEAAGALWRRRSRKAASALALHLAEASAADAESIVRFAATSSLPARVWPKERLDAFVSHPVPAIRNAARSLLVAMGDKRARSFCEKLAKGTEDERRACTGLAGLALSRPSSPAWVERLLRQFLRSDESLHVRLLALETMGARADTRDASKLLETAIDDENPYFRLKAARLLFLIRGRRRADLRGRWLKSETDEIVRSALKTRWR